MPKIEMTVKMILATPEGIRVVPQSHSQKGTRVDELLASGEIVLKYGMMVANVMQIGDYLSRINNQGEFNFARIRDIYSVDISEAAGAKLPVSCVFEFLAWDTENWDTAVFALTAYEMRYVAHTKIDNENGLLERIHLKFAPNTSVVRYGHNSMRAMAIIREMSRQQAQRDAVIGVAREVGKIISNWHAF